MATKRISELTAITAVTTDDNLIINDGNTATRRITFGNFMNSVAGENTTFSGNVTFDGTTSGISLDELTDVDLTTSAPTEGQVLQYDATGAKFVPSTLGSGVFSTLAAFAGALDNDINFSTTINTRLESLTGVAAAGTNLGTFSGATISDGRNIKEALQDLETSLEAIDIDTDDLAALTGISENTTNLGTFTGTTISDNVAVKVALQEVETAVELRATAASVSNVDNTSDADKPISTATQTSLDLKAPLAAPTFTGDVTIGAGAFYKSSNERLGLGTTAPNGRLHVKTSSGIAARFERETGSSALVVKNNTSDDGMTIQGSANSINSIRFEGYGNNIGFRFAENDGGTVTDLMHIKSSGIDFDKDVTFRPSASVTPSANGDLMVEATDNTTLTFKLKGSDGTVRTGTITLS